MASTNKTSISALLMKYDYALTSHPQAHEEVFIKANLQKLKADLNTLTSKMTKEELISELEVVLAKVPTQEQRDAFVKLLESSTTQELANFFANPALLEAALRGEGANFAMNWEDNAAGYVLGAALIVLVIGAIIQGIKKSKYDYFVVSSGSSNCSNSTLNDLIDSAHNQCLAGASNPDNCELDYVVGANQTTTNASGAQIEISCEAGYKAKK
jgi:hypothetical protein